MRVTARADTRGIDALIAASRAIDSPAQIRKEAEASRKEIKRLYEENFTLEQSPEDVPWAARKASYPHPLLRETYALWSTLEVAPLPDGVFLSTGIEYAEHLHWGTASMEPRRLVPVGYLGQRWDNGIGQARLSAAPVLP